MEVLIIFAVNVFDAKQQSKWVGYMIHVPENMKLTINKDISVSANDETILLKQNTTIEPSYIYPDRTVFFHFGETEEMLSVSWNCFVEQEQLETLKKKQIKNTKQLNQKNEKWGFSWSCSSDKLVNNCRFDNYSVDKEKEVQHFVDSSCWTSFNYLFGISICKESIVS